MTGHKERAARVRGFTYTATQRKQIRELLAFVYKDQEDLRWLLRAVDRSDEDVTWKPWELTKIRQMRRRLGMDR